MQPQPKPSRREQILRATLEVGGAHGHSGLTMKRIASMVGVSQAALYRHFRNKQDLLQAVFGFIDEVFVTRTMEIGSSEALTSADRLTGVLRHYFQSNWEMNGFPIWFFAEALSTRHPSFQFRLEEIVSRDARVIKEVLSRSVAPSLKGREVELGWLMWGLPIAISIWAPVLGGQETRERVVERVFPLLVDFLTGWVPTSEAVLGQTGSDLHFLVEEGQYDVMPTADSATEAGPKEKKQAEIMRAVLKLMDEHGLASLTMKRTAQRVGVTETALYYYFRTKEDILVALQIHFRHVFVDAQKEIQARSDLPPKQRLAFTMRHLVQGCLQFNGMAVRLLGEIMATGLPRQLDYLKTIQAMDMETMRGIIAEALPPGHVHPPEDIVWLVRGLPSGLTIWAPMQPALEEETQRLLDLIPLLLDFVTAVPGEVAPGRRS